MFVTTKRGVKLCYELVGPEGAPVIVLVNGWTEQMAAWKPEFIEGLVSGNFRVLRFDNRDCGYSQSFATDSSFESFCRVTTLLLTFFYVPPYTLKDMADDLHGLLECLQIHEPVHVFGFSMGGCISQLFAMHYPQHTASLTLFGTFWGKAVDNPVAVALFHTIKPKSASTSDIVDAVLPLHFMMDGTKYPSEEKELRKRVKYLVSRAKAAGAPPDGYIRQWLALYAHASANSSQLASITCSTLVLVGTADRMVLPENSDKLIKHIPNAKFKKYEGIGHSFPIQHMDIVCADILEHIKSAQSPRATATATATHDNRL